MRRRGWIGLSTLMLGAACSGAPWRPCDGDQAVIMQHGEDPQSPYLLGYKPFCQATDAAPGYLSARVGSFDRTGAQKDGVRIENLRVEKGELMGEVPGANGGAPRTLRGGDLTKVTLTGVLQNNAAVGQFRILTVKKNDSEYENKAVTWLYQLEYSADGWQTYETSLCLNASGRPEALWAIPITEVVDMTGHVSTSSVRFTLSCGLGALAECVKWRFEPGTDKYQACVRAARADYCGVGELADNTCPGTTIQYWTPNDKRPPPDPQYPDLDFEGAWDRDGAICLKHVRWSHLPPRACGPALQAARCDDETKAQQVAAAQHRTILLFTTSVAHVGEKTCPAPLPPGVVDK